MESLEPYETRKPTETNWFERFTDQERRYYQETEEMKRKASFNHNSKRQQQALSDPQEAVKINRLRKELSRSKGLTEVEDDFHLFEAATNKHFNKEMNREAVTEQKQAARSRMESNAQGSAAAYESIKSNILASVESKGSEEVRYDRMAKRDFSRKTNSYAPILMNDSYSNFRFTNRASEVLSPLSKGKFGFTNHHMNKHLRKMSLTQTGNPLIAKSEFNSLRNSQVGQKESNRNFAASQTASGFHRLGQKNLRHNSLANDTQTSDAGTNVQSKLFKMV